MAETSQSYDTVHPAITEVTADPQDLLAVVYGNSNANTYNALAFQVVRSVRRVERVEGLFSLNDNGTKEFGYVGESGFSADVSSPGTELFAIDSERNSTLGEYGFAVQPDGVYVGVQTADGDSLTGFREGSERERGFSADDLPNRGGVLSEQTRAATPAPSIPEAIPTTALAPRPDQGLVRVDSRDDGPNRFFFAFNNQSGGSVNVDLTLYGATYDVRPIEDEATTRTILRGDDYSRRILNYGGFGNTNPNLPQTWYDYAVDIRRGELVPGSGQ